LKIYLSKQAAAKKTSSLFQNIFWGEWVLPFTKGAIFKKSLTIFKAYIHIIYMSQPNQRSSPSVTSKPPEHWHALWLEKTRKEWRIAAVTDGYWQESTANV
jgi:hypothetical protein